jgi:hypothetical protein
LMGTLQTSDEGFRRIERMHIRRSALRSDDLYCATSLEFSTRSGATCPKRELLLSFWRRQQTLRSITAVPKSNRAAQKSLSARRTPSARSICVNKPSDSIGSGQTGLGLEFSSLNLLSGGIEVHEKAPPVLGWAGPRKQVATAALRRCFTYALHCAVGAVGLRLPPASGPGTAVGYRNRAVHWPPPPRRLKSKSPRLQ